MSKSCRSAKKDESHGWQANEAENTNWAIRCMYSKGLQAANIGSFLVAIAGHFDNWHELVVSQ
jgi:hypothetical protein